MNAKAWLAVLVLVAFNSLLLVVTVKASSVSGDARRVALATCKELVTGRQDVNTNRRLNLDGWTVAFQARLVNARNSVGAERAVNLAAARVYRRIVDRYTFLAKPVCVNRTHLVVRWTPPPSKPTLAKVPAR